MSRLPHPDEHDAVTLLRPLSGEPAGPGRIDVGRAMAEGRRRRRNRWWAGGSAVAALTATTVAGGTLALSAADRPVPGPTVSPSVTAVARPPRDCTLTRLTAPGAESALVTGADSSGRWVIGRAYGPGAQTRLAVWHDAGPPRLTDLPARSRIEDINSAGAAVGVTYPAGRRPTAYLDGRLSTLAGGAGAALAINDAGVVVGGLGADRGAQPVWWASTTAQPEPLPLPAGARYGLAVDVDEAGNVIGTVTDSGDSWAQVVQPPDEVGYLWAADGTGRPFPPPVVDGFTGDRFRPLSIRNGWVVGYGTAGTGTGQTSAAFRYRIDTGRYERILGPRQMDLPDRVAANGSVPTGGRQPGITDAAMVITELPADPENKGGSYDLPGLSDDGLTVAGGWTGNTGSRPLLWRCR